VAFCSDPHNNVIVLCAIDVYSVTQLHGVVYLVCHWSSTVLRFDATTHQRMTDIYIRDMTRPSDIVACDRTSQLYVADNEEYVWRVSPDGADVKRWLPRTQSDQLMPHSLSVTSTRLLVTSHHSKQLIQFDERGDELRRVRLPDYMEPWHAVESPTGSFIVSHDNTQQDLHRITDVDADGEVLRHFGGSGQPSLGWSSRVAVDSNGNVFVTGHNGHCILLLGTQLTLRRVLVDERNLDYKQPWSLSYIEETEQLLVGLKKSVAVFNVLYR